MLTRTPHQAQKVAQAQRNIQIQRRLRRAGNAGRAAVLPAVPRVEHDGRSAGCMAAVCALRCVRTAKTQKYRTVANSMTGIMISTHFFI